jgi:hypothetical protein
MAAIGTHLIAIIFLRKLCILAISIKSSNGVRRTKWAVAESVLVEDIKCVMNGYFWSEKTSKVAADHLLLWSEILT